MIIEAYKQTIDWLMKGDPAIVWQVKRDILDYKEEDYIIDREKVAETGWGKELLDKQSRDGKWANGLYTPKWTSTTYTLLLLRRLGLSPKNLHAKKGAEILLNKGTWNDGGINFFNSRKTSETCVTSLVFSILSYFRVENEYLKEIFNYLKKNQMADGGWNCRYADYGDTHASMHTTLMVLEALHEYKNFSPSITAEITNLQEKGQEFLLRHQLFKSHTTGKVMNQKMLSMTFPPRWKYNILSALDYFRSENYLKDERLEEAINLLLKKEKKGFWSGGSQHAGKIWFKMEETSQLSRWNTLRALRVLKWWETINL